MPEEEKGKEMRETPDGDAEEESLEKPRPGEEGEGGEKDREGKDAAADSDEGWLRRFLGIGADRKKEAEEVKEAQEIEERPADEKEPAPEQEAPPEPPEPEEEPEEEQKEEQKEEPIPEPPAGVEKRPRQDEHVPVAEGTEQVSEQFWYALVLFVVFRFFALFLLRPGGFVRDWSDFDTFLGIAALSDYGLYPFMNFWLEWPPLVPWLFVGSYRLSLFLPPWTDARLWFTLILGTVFLLFEAGNFWLVYRLSRRLFAGDGEAAVMRPVWMYALLFPPFYAFLGFFDTIALFFLLLALDLMLADRGEFSALSLAVGFLTKITPVVMLPVALRRLWKRGTPMQTTVVEWLIYLVTFTLTVLVVLAPFIYLGPSWLLTSARSILARSSWETVWAIAEGYTGFGVVGGDRLNPAETDFSAHAGWLPWWFTLVPFAALYAYLWWRRADYKNPRNVLAFGGLTMALFLMYSKGYSPQFLAYVLPFVVLLIGGWRGVLYVVTLTVLNVFEQPVYFVLVPESGWLLAWIVFWRWLIWAMLLVDFGGIIWGGEMKRIVRVRRYAPLVLHGLIALWVVVAVPFTLRDYKERRLEEDPARHLVAFMRSPQAKSGADTLIFTQQELYQRLYPHLKGEYDLRLAGGASSLPGAPTVADLTAGLSSAWLVPSGETATDMERAMAAQGLQLISADLVDGYRASLYDFTGSTAPTRPPVAAHFLDSITLVASNVERMPGGDLRVTHFWRAEGVPSRPYTVFNHVLDPGGELVAGKDGPPVGGSMPTDTWTPGPVIPDEHEIQLPPLPPGRYRLEVGLYDVGGNRLLVVDTGGLLYENNGVMLTEFDVR